MKTLPEPIAFIWDSGNSGKSERKHGISDRQAEEPFFEKQKIIYRDKLHSNAEKRFILLGRTKIKQLLYIVFTYRKVKIRIISARIINKKEVHLYEKTINNS